jgi:hypothetical protein
VSRQKSKKIRARCTISKTARNKKKAMTRTFEVHRTEIAFCFPKGFVSIREREEGAFQDLLPRVFANNLFASSKILLPFPYQLPA